MKRLSYQHAESAKIRLRFAFLAFMAEVESVEAGRGSVGQEGGAVSFEALDFMRMGY